MKKIISIALLLAVAALCLCACGGTAAPALSGSAADSRFSAEPAAAYGTFKMLTSPIYQGYGSGNSLGFYHIERDEQGARLQFTDYQAKQIMYVCPQPNCKHDTENCPACLPPKYRDLVVAAAEDKLFLLLSGQTDGGSIIQTADLDGSNRQTIYTAESGKSMSNMVAYDGENLVFCISCLAENDSEKLLPTYKLLCLNAKSQQVTELFSLDEFLDLSQYLSWGMDFLGVTDDGFFISISVQEEYEYCNEDIDQTLANMYAAQPCTVYCIPFDGSAPQKILTARGPYDFRGRVYNAGFFYSIKNPNSSVSLHRWRSGVDTVLMTDVMQTIGNTDQALLANDVYFWEQLDDGHIMLSVLTDQYVDPAGNITLSYTGAAVDVESGEQTIIELTDYYAATYMPVYPLARHGEQLLVLSTHDDPGLTTTMRAVDTLYMISADDFLHSRPNYIPIEAIA